MNSTYIINCTNKLNLTKKQKDKLSFAAKQLQKIKELDSNIQEIGIAGSFTLDILLELDINDVDIKYTILDSNGKLTQKCKCDYIQKLVDQTEMKKLGAIDVSNLLETGHCYKNSLLEKHVGFFSHHPDYLSMWILDHEGNIWTNKDTIRDFKNRVHEYRPDGILSWIFTGKRKYYDSLSSAVIRGLGYIHKRDLKMGQNYRTLLEHTPQILEELVKEGIKPEGWSKYFYAKVKSIENLENLLDKHKIENKDEIINKMVDIFEL